MMHTIRRWLILGSCLIVFPHTFLGTCRGDDGPKAADASTTTDSPLPYVLPSPPVYNGDERGWIGNPLLERPEAASSGLFFNLESSVLWPHFSNELLGGQVTLAQLSGVSPVSNVGLPPGAGLPITGDIVKFPGNKLDPTVSPQFELGYRFPDGFGEVRFSYRFMDSRGSDTVFLAPPVSEDTLGPAAQTGRLAINIVDLDYGTREFSLGPNWEMRTAVGLRLASAFLDSRVTFLKPVTVTGSPFGTGPFTRLSQTETLGNQYIGANAVFELDRKLWTPGLAWFARLEGAGMYGTIRQTFTETFVEPPGFTRLSLTNGVGTPMLAVQLGLSYEVPRWNHSRFLIGYQFEEWWQFGRGFNDVSFGALYDQGLFLRAEFNF